MRRAIALLLVLSSSISLAGDIEGVWQTADDEGLIRLEQNGDELIGTIAGSRKPPVAGEPERVDELNPDPALRQRPLFGLQIMSGLKPDGEGRWKGGTIYDPNSGKTYKCKLRMVDEDTLEVRGYIGISLVGRTETWRRDNKTTKDKSD